jgi:hypothetical protein
MRTPRTEVETVKITLFRWAGQWGRSAYVGGVDDLAVRLHRKSVMPNPESRQCSLSPGTAYRRAKPSIIAYCTLNRVIVVFALGLFLHACAISSPERLKQRDVRVTGSYVTLISDEGRKRIARSTRKVDFVSLMGTFMTQERQTLCSVATGVTILNALPLKRPVDPKYKPYPFFTQTNYFNDRVNRVITRDTTLRIGQTLDQAAAVMAAHGAKTWSYHAADSSLEKFRRIAMVNLSQRDNFIAVNYRRNYVGQPPGAHFSPLAAYDEETDSFLILDVARYKFPPTWVSAKDLFAAMNTLDADSGKTRGFLVVSVPDAMR